MAILASAIRSVCSFFSPILISQVRAFASPWLFFKVLGVRVSKLYTVYGGCYRLIRYHSAKRVLNKNVR